MEAEIPVAARERVAAFAVAIEPGGAGDDDFAPGSFRIVASAASVGRVG